MLFRSGGGYRMTGNRVALAVMARGKRGERVVGVRVTG